MLRFKPDVRIGYLTPQLTGVLQLATLWSYRARMDVEVNSVDDAAANRSPSTLHGYSLAVDLDTVGDREIDTSALADYLRRMLDPQYDVVFEGNHVHVEWDAHRGPIRK